MEYANQLAYALADPRPGNPDSKGMAYMYSILSCPKSRRREEARRKQRLTIADENDALGRETVHDGGTTLAGNRVALHPSSFVSPGYPGNERKMIHGSERPKKGTPPNGNQTRTWREVKNYSR